MIARLRNVFDSPLSESFGARIELVWVRALSSEEDLHLWL